MTDLNYYENVLVCQKGLASRTLDRLACLVSFNFGSAPYYLCTAMCDPQQWIWLAC